MINSLTNRWLLPSNINVLNLYFKSFSQLERMFVLFNYYSSRALGGNLVKRLQPANYLNSYHDGLKRIDR